MKKIILLFILISNFVYSQKEYTFDTYYRYIDAVNDESFVLLNSSDPTYILCGRYEKTNVTIGKLISSNSNVIHNFLVKDLYELEYLAQESSKMKLSNKYEYTFIENKIDDEHLKLEINLLKIRNKSKKVVRESYLKYKKSNEFKFNSLAIDYYTHNLVRETEFKETNFGYPIEIYSKDFKGNEYRVNLISKLKINKSVNMTVND